MAGVSRVLPAGVVGAGGMIDVRDEQAANTAGGPFTSGAQADFGTTEVYAQVMIFKLS